jgi:hypothetical protein
LSHLEQEIRHTIKRCSEVNLASIERSETSIAATAGRVAINRISDQARPLVDNEKPSPAFCRSDHVANISISASDGSSISPEDSYSSQQGSLSVSSPSGLGQKPESCVSTMDTAKAVQRASTQSAASMDNMSTEYLSPPNLSGSNDRNCPEDLGKSHAPLADSLAELNGISGNQLSTYPSSPHATDATEEIKRIGEIDNILTSETSGKSTELLSLAKLPSPNRSKGKSKSKRGQHQLFAITSAESTE